MKTFLIVLLVGWLAGVSITSPIKKESSDRVFQYLNQELKLSQQQTPGVFAVLDKYGSCFKQLPTTDITGNVNAATKKYVFDDFKNSLRQVLRPEQIGKLNAQSRARILSLYQVKN